MDTSTFGSANGTSVKKARRITLPAPVRPSRKQAARLLSARRKIAVGVGGVGVTLLVLSVYHCCEALCLLTGAPVLLAGLLAVGIDAGLVASELAAIVADDDYCVSRWANAYIVVALVLSAGLNSMANGLHSAEYRWLAHAVGLVIPGLVFILAKLTGLLWRVR
jgi:hypothetical protein